MASTPPQPLHVVLFPFMAKGHTIPILQLAHLLLRRPNATVTLFTTPANLPYESTSLSDTPASIVTLPFPNNIPGVPSGVESVDKLPSLAHFYNFVSTKFMKFHFEQAIRDIKTPVTFMVTDGFFGWTLESANALNIPRLVYYGMGNFANTTSRVISLNPRLFDGKDDNERVVVPELPWIKATRLEFDDAFTEHGINSPLSQWVAEQVHATTNSYGLVTNSFFELEPVYAEYWNSKLNPKSWSVGPFCLCQGQRKKENLSGPKPSWMVWLDQKLELGSPVLYVAFGSQADISIEQIEEIKLGLERSEVSFLWVMRRSENDLVLDDGFEERVKDKGTVVREWVDQREILEREIVKGFMSHCGWNSVLESICAAVPILAWPLAAEQPLNAKFVVEELQIAVRVETWDRSVKGFVKWEGLRKKVKELMEGVEAKEMRKKVKEISDATIKAVEDGGSSWRTLDELIVDLQNKV
ncbi:UDP-glycosyltransferase 90A1-like [Bidens hawaiensis]|uniref:UDP-glycosyltransferase 90A1-like n=1 Tax=Bidens hawaiensis TaxID=980011 RepID=UPI004049A26E